MARRSYGSGRLYVETNANGVESWYGSWYSSGRRVKRKIGLKRVPASREGLTRAQAERELRRLTESERPVVRSRLTVAAAGAFYVEHLEHVMERKPTTIGDYQSMLRRHIGPFFGDRPLERIDADDIRRYLTARKHEGLATKTITNQLIFLHGVFGFALKRGWIHVNPVTLVDRPRAPASDPDIHFLELSELDALLRATPDDDLGRLDHALYLTAAMTGMRQGELIALRWADVDWRAARIRVRRNYTRQKFGTPKSKRSSRSVPMADRVAAELERHFQRSSFTDEEDLVFCHPHTGNPLDATRLRKRFKAALKAAAIRPVRFHDLRHTFGTLCAAAGVPMRTLQEWMGHATLATTEVYADYAPSTLEKSMVERAFSREVEETENGAPHEDPRGIG